jgi:hypothetical protein
MLDQVPFYHMWLEINGTVIDLAIYGNVNYNPPLTWSFKLGNPYIGSYDKAFLKYGKFVFDEDWKRDRISKVEGWTVQEYMDRAPYNSMWKITCKLLDVVPTQAITTQLSEHIQGVSFEKQ